MHVYTVSSTELKDCVPPDVSARSNGPVSSNPLLRLIIQRPIKFWVECGILECSGGSVWLTTVPPSSPSLFTLSPSVWRGWGTSTLPLPPSLPHSLPLTCSLSFVAPSAWWHWGTLPLSLSHLLLSITLPPSLSPSLPLIVGPARGWT